MANDEQACYVYIQLPGTLDTVPCASLRVRAVGAGAYEGTFTYGKRYLERAEVVALDPFHLPLSTRPQKFTKLKGIPGAVRDASPDAWGRRVIQAKLQRPEADIQEVDYLLNGPDDGAGNVSSGRTATPPAPRRPFNRTHQLAALIEAAATLEEDGRLPHEVLEELEPGTSMGGARPKVTVEDNHKIWLAKLPEKGDRRELFLRMVFNAMATNNDDHPRNHALLQTKGGWRLSPAYDILPVPLVSLERRDLALEVGRFGRAASLYNILSQCNVFGLTKDEAQRLIDGMLAVVHGWREFFIQRGVEQRSIEMLEQAMLPPSFFRDTPPDAV